MSAGSAAVGRANGPVDASAPGSRSAGVNEVIREILRTGRVADASGQTYDPVSAVGLESGQLLYDFIRSARPEATLETGMAYGLSTLFICQALEDNGAGTHTAIDPFQTSEFKGIGRLNIERARLTHRLGVYEEPSDLVLPRLCAERRAVDFAFIDGWHLFDFTLIDFYYIDKILRVGGHVAFDDLWLPSVRKVVSFVLRNKPYTLVRRPSRYPAPVWKRVMRIGRRVAQDPLGRNWSTKLLPQNVAFLQKTAEDNRGWQFHRAF